MTPPSTPAKAPLPWQSHWLPTSPQTRVRALVAVLLLLGTASVVLEGIVFRDLRRDVPLALFASDGLLGTEKPAVDASPGPTVIVAHSAVVLPVSTTPAPLSPPSPSPTPEPESPHTTLPTFASPLERQCFYERDLGLLTEIHASKREFCASSDRERDDTNRTHVTFIDLVSIGSIPLRALVFDRDFQLDFTIATIHRPIASLAHDGGDHDPRFNWLPTMISCGCTAFQQFARDVYRASGNTTTLRPWDPMLAGTSETRDEASTVCGAPDAPTIQTVPPPAAFAPPLVISEKTVVITRRDDHNPFFQVASALNAWLLMRTLGWQRNETRVILMDGGYASPIDALHYRLLSTPDKYSLLRGSEHLMGHQLQFKNQVLIAPYETTGPLMQHLNDVEPCQRSQLIEDFRADALKAMGVVELPNEATTPVTITIISRRNYGGRQVQRRWRNEQEILDVMRTKYTKTQSGRSIVIESIDFVDLTLAQQMHRTLHSDVVIGMHGAGMVNVLWTKPETLVIEIFPRHRRRWGYRNICQYIGCDWHEFRGGKDTGRGDNASDKTIPVHEWMAFFDPLFRRQVDLPQTTSVGLPGTSMEPRPTPARSSGDAAPSIY